MNSDRPHQEKAIAANVTDYDAGLRRMLTVMATGTGKTHVFGRMFEVMKSRLPGQQMIFAHTKELVAQAQEDMVEMYPHLKIGREMGTAKADVESDIIVASIETLGREDSKRVDRFDWNKFDKLVVDEAHHSTGGSYRRVFERAGCLAPDTHKLLMGVTATPERPDGAALSDVFEKVSYVYSIRQAIEDGWLVDVKGYRLRTTTSLANVGKSEGDFNKAELSQAIDTPARNEQVVNFWKKYADGRQTIVFCVDIQHSADMAKAFRDAGVPAVHVYGEDEERGDKIKAFKSNEFPVICSCDLLTEGFDAWQVSCVVLARPTMSPIKFAQMVGRGTRLHAGTGNLKDAICQIDKWPGLKVDLLVLDVVDNASRHSLITLPSLMGISSNLDLQGRSLLEVVGELEAAQDEYPSLDLAKLQTIGELKETVEKIDLFEIRFPEEVEANSELTWFRAVGGGYKILVPKPDGGKSGHVQIFQNTIGRWEIDAEINDDSLHGIRPTFEEAIKAADEQIRKRVGAKTLSCVKREATWHNKPVTGGQKKLLTRLFPKRDWPFEHMTSGQASKILSERFTRRHK